MQYFEFNPPIGKAEVLAKGIRRIVAPNPSPMTYRGTNTYLLGHKKIFLIDPGPDDPNHLAAIREAIVGSRLLFILVTHSHLDHSPLASKLARETDAQVLAFGDSFSGRSAVMQKLAETGLAGGGEGVDTSFAPDQEIVDSELFATDEWQLEMLHTPGHMGNHISVRWDDSVFSGDLVMGWASSLVSPPDGDLTDFLSSCEKLKQSKPRTLYPGHGAPVTDPVARINWLIDHRSERAADILTALAEKSKTIQVLTKEIYSDVDPNLHPAAARNIFAHLIDLHQRNHVVARPLLGPNATFSLNQK